jgi:hypothetical protein
MFSFWRVLATLTKREGMAQAAASEEDLLGLVSNAGREGRRGEKRDEARAKEGLFDLWLESCRSGVEKRRRSGDRRGRHIHGRTALSRYEVQPATCHNQFSMLSKHDYYYWKFYYYRCPRAGKDKSVERRGLCHVASQSRRPCCPVQPTPYHIP